MEVADHITDRLWLPCRRAGSARQRLRGYSADSPALPQPFNFSMSFCRVRRLDAPMPPQAAQHDAGKFYPLPSLPTLSKHFIFYSVSAFSFYLKKKTPAKEKQTQGFAPRPRERRAAVHSLCYSVGGSAHSPVNALELGRVRARAAYKVRRSALSKHSRLSPLERALCSLFFANIASLYPPPAALRRRCPRSQMACYTAARLLEVCSSKFIKSLTLPCGKCPYSLFFVFCVFRKATSCRINLGRIISDHTRFNIRQPLYFCGRTKLPLRCDS